MNHVITLVATVFYAGNLPSGARRIAVSAIALLLFTAAGNLHPPAYLGFLLSFFILGFLVTGSAEKLFDRSRAEPIAIDEVGGMLLSLTLAPAHPLALLLGLVLFHLFHRLKPWPIPWIGNHLHGGIGIMGDDAVAGLYAGIFLHLLWWPLASLAA